MIKVHVVVEEIEGLEISSAVDSAGTIWVVMNPRAPDPYGAFADLMKELVGCLPDACTYEVARTPQLQGAW